MTGTQKWAFPCRHSSERTALIALRRGDVAIINLSDPDRWVLEHVLPGVGGRTLGGAGHSDIVRCSYLDTKVRRVTSKATRTSSFEALSRRDEKLNSLVSPVADFDGCYGWGGWTDLLVVNVTIDKLFH